MLNAWIPVGRPTGIPLCLHPSVKDVVIEPVNHVVILDTRGSAPIGSGRLPVSTRAHTRVRPYSQFPHFSAFGSIPVADLSYPFVHKDLTRTGFDFLGNSWERTWGTFEKREDWSPHVYYFASLVLKFCFARKQAFQNQSSFRRLRP